MSKNSLKEIIESLMVNKVELAIRDSVSPNTITPIEHGLPYRIDAKLKIIKSIEHIISDETEVMAPFIKDNGDKRLGLNRRQYSYDKFIPERRSGQDRRTNLIED